MKKCINIGKVKFSVRCLFNIYGKGPQCQCFLTVSYSKLSALERVFRTEGFFLTKGKKKSVKWEYRRLQMQAAQTQKQ